MITVNFWTNEGKGAGRSRRLLFLACIFFSLRKVWQWVAQQFFSQKSFEQMILFFTKIAKAAPNTFFLEMLDRMPYSTAVASRRYKSRRCGSV
jgi:hypothetical protein